MSKSWMRIVGAAAVLLVAALLPVVLAWDSLPDPFASHWSLGGEPDSHLPKLILPILPTSLVALGLLISVLFRIESRPSAEGQAVLWLLGGIAVGVTATTVALNRGAAVWSEASPMPWWYLVLVLVSSIGLGWLGFILGRRWYPQPELSPSGEVPSLTLSDGERVAWTGTCTVRYTYLIAGAGMFAFLLVPHPWRWMALPFLLVALALSHVRVIVNEHGLDARMGGVFWRKIKTSQIARAELIDLNPAEWGGWGYRMGPGRTAMVLRRGPAIDVHLHGGRRFAVTVDDAATGVALINGLVARHARLGR